MKLVPVRTTDVPAVPLVGVKLVIFGAAANALAVVSRKTTATSLEKAICMTEPHEMRGIDYSGSFL